MRRPPPLRVDGEDAAVLTRWAKGRTSSAAMRRRARIVLLSAAGIPTATIADKLGCSRQTVVTWRERYREDGLAGLSDQPRSGRPVGVDPAAVIVRTLWPAPDGLNRWTVRSLASEMGISSTAVANVWRGWGIATVVGGVALLTDPVLDEHVLDVVGVYVDSRVQAVAVATGAMVTETDVASGRLPIDARPAFDGRLGRFGTVPTEPGCPAAFFDQVSGTRGARVVTSEESLPGVEGLWPRGLLHVVRPPAQWQRVARVACLLAGATMRGSTSVTALAEALDRHLPGIPFRWPSGDHTSASDDASLRRGRGPRPEIG